MRAVPAALFAALAATAPSVAGECPEDLTLEELVACFGEQAPSAEGDGHGEAGRAAPRDAPPAAPDRPDAGEDPAGGNDVDC